MCQLLYTNLKDPYLNSLIIYLLFDIGSSKHDDGTGFIATDNMVWKSMMAANRISNFGEILFKNIEGEKPVPAHIRQATFGIEVSKENSHPFDGKNFILMHNGTLVPRNGEEPKDKKKDSDSLKFLEALDSEREKNPKSKFTTIFNKAMEKFAGKFAFIVREKNTDHDYIIRGKTADLYISYLKVNGDVVGYVVETSKETMNAGFKHFTNIAELTTGNRYDFGEPMLLKQETIFLADADGLKELGEAKEFTPPKHEIVYPTTAASPSKSFTGGNAGTTSSSGGITHTNTGTGSIKEVARLIKLAVKIYLFLRDQSLSMLDFQIMFKELVNCSLLEATEEDLILFVEYLVPKISANKKMRKQVKKYLNGKSFPIGLYNKYDLEYPWMLNSGDSILKALRTEAK